MPTPIAPQMRLAPHLVALRLLGIQRRLAAARADAEHLADPHGRKLAGVRAEALRIQASRLKAQAGALRIEMRDARSH